MPNAKCDKCHQYLQDICISDKQKLLLIKLIKLRSKKRFGIVYNIHPGITHDEINPDNTSLNGNKCDGILWYDHFCSNPKGFENIDFSKIIFDSTNIEEIEKKLLDNINHSQVVTTPEYFVNENEEIIKGVVSLSNEVFSNQENYKKNEINNTIKNEINNTIKMEINDIEKDKYKIISINRNKYFDRSILFFRYIYIIIVFYIFTIIYLISSVTNYFI